tara:strand:- start:8755 stop:8904 length:150 start_codon:yes stop_codon:yes gene_type:complete
MPFRIVDSKTGETVLEMAMISDILEWYEKHPGFTPKEVVIHAVEDSWGS